MRARGRHVPWLRDLLDGRPECVGPASPNDGKVADVGRSRVGPLRRPHTTLCAFEDPHIGALAEDRLSQRYQRNFGPQATTRQGHLSYGGARERRRALSMPIWWMSCA